MDNYSKKACFSTGQESDERDPNTVDWIEEETGSCYNHLSPMKHPQRDLFIADLFDTVSFQLDQASMEYPLFALKAKDIRPRYYEQKGFKVAITANATFGLATIHDKDVWIYSISKLAQAMKDNEPIDRTIHFTIYDYLKTTNRRTGGREYELAKDSLDRLAGTRITTEIETDKKREARGFGLIDSWKVVEEKDGRMVRVSVTLPEWLYRSVTSKNLLTLSPDYFRIRKPLDRRVYELARKHCGNGKEWKFNLKTLHERTGSTASIREFKRSIKSLAESDQLPDYHVFLIEKHLRTDTQKDDDQVMFINRKQPKMVAKSFKDDGVGYEEFSSGKYEGETTEAVVVSIFAKGEKLSQALINKLGLDGKTLKVLQQRAQTIINGSNSTPKPQAKQFILNDETIAKIKANIVKDVGIGLTEEYKLPLFKVEIAETYERLSHSNVIVDSSGSVLSEMAFKQAMYKSFNIEVQ